MQSAGMNDATIIPSLLAITAPAFIWLAQRLAGRPIPLVLAGLVGICMFLWKYRKPSKIATVVGEIELDDPAVAKYKDQIEKNLANLE